MFKTYRLHPGRLRCTINKSMAFTRPELLVAEYSGTARSGKGSIVKHLSEGDSAVASEETGADYRAVTKTLLLGGELERGMSDENVARALASVSFEALADMVARRHDLVGEYGLDALYQPDVTELVSLVSPIAEVRKAVKAGFKTRVEAVRDDDEHDILLVDGRNLNSVIETVEGVRLLMRTFVSCQPIEAAWRECMRSGIDLSSDEGQKILQAITERNRNDALRQNDPVAPDSGAIEYWYDDLAFDAAIRSYADELCGGDFEKALDVCFRKPAEEFKHTTKLGAGVLAVGTGRQIHFDTTSFRGHHSSKEAMLDASEQMLGEALEAMPTMVSVR